MKTRAVVLLAEEQSGLSDYLGGDSLEKVVLSRCWLAIIKNGQDVGWLVGWLVLLLNVFCSFIKRNIHKLKNNLLD